MHVKKVETIKRKHTYMRKSPGPGTKLEIFRESLKTVTKNYCAESSICGLKHLVSEDTAWIERILWAIILIIGLFCSVSLVWVTYDKYYKAPLVTTQMPEGVSISKIIFPAVGICTNNRISKRSVTELARRLLKEERNKGYKEEEMLSLIFGLGQLYDMQPMNDDIIVPPLLLHKVLGKYNVHEMMRNLTPRCEDLLISCAWNDEPKQCSELFDFRLTVSGYCCTFNYLRFSDVSFRDEDSGIWSMDMYNYGNKSTFDFDQGLKVLLRLNESDDFYYNTPLQGAKLQFSDAYDFPDGPSGSFAMQIISPGVQMTVMVSATFTEASRDIQHVPVALRKCRFYDESTYLPFYTYSDCIMKCRMFFLLEKCNCTPFTIPKMDGVRTCDMRDVICLRKYFAQTITVRPHVELEPPELELELVGGGIYCPMCCPTCDKTVYSFDFNNINIYPEYLNLVPDDDRDHWLLQLTHTVLIIPSTFELTPIQFIIKGCWYIGIVCGNFYIGNIPTAEQRCLLVQACTEIWQVQPAEAALSIYSNTWVGALMTFIIVRRKGVNFSGASLVHVKYARDVADCYGQNVIMKWFDLISNIGSTCGFVTGFSFVSVLEFIYFYTVKLFREIQFRRCNRIRTASTIEARPVAPESMSRYRPIYWNELTGPTNFGKNFTMLWSEENIRI